MYQQSKCPYLYFLQVWEFHLTVLFPCEYPYMKYRKYPNLVRTQVEIISDPNYLVGIVFEW